MKYKPFTYIAFISILLSCEKRELYITNNTHTFRTDGFEKTEHLIGENLEEVSSQLFLPSRIFVSGDFLFCDERVTDSTLHIINIKKDRYLGLFGARGAGPGEMLTPWKFFSSGNGEIGVYDVELGKALIYDIDTLLKENRPSREIIHRDMLWNNGIGLFGNNIILTGSVQQVQDSRFLKLALSDQHAGLEKIGELPRLNKNFKGKKDDFSRVLEDDYRALTFASLASKEDLFVMAYHLIPLIEIYNLGKNLRISISGPDDLPPFEVLGKPLYYSSPCITDKYIYVLYMEDIYSELEHSNTILVIDHDGSEVKKLILDIDIFQFTVYEDKYIYALTASLERSDHAILKFKIN